MSEAGVFTAEGGFEVWEPDPQRSGTSLPVLEVYHSAGGNAVIRAMDEIERGGHLYPMGRRGGIDIPAETMTALCKWWLRNHNAERCPTCGGEGWTQKE